MTTVQQQWGRLSSKKLDRELKIAMADADRLTIWYERDSDGHGGKIFTGVTVAIIAREGFRYIGISRGKHRDPIGKSVTKQKGREIALGRALAAMNQHDGTQERPFINADLSRIETLDDMLAECLSISEGRFYCPVDSKSKRIITAVPEELFLERELHQAAV